MAYTWNTANNTAWTTAGIPTIDEFNRYENNFLYTKQELDYLRNTSMWGGI